MPEHQNRCDVLIGGAGFAGLALAIALKQALGPAYKVTVADPALGRDVNDPRATAIVAAARRLFETIGVWQAGAGGAPPIFGMRITRNPPRGAGRPGVFPFAAGCVPGG